MRLASLLFVLCAASSAALAAVEWTGPGWYVVETDEDADTWKLISGPFANLDSCKAALPKHSYEDYEDTGIDYFCNNWPTRPTQR